MSAPREDVPQQAQPRVERAAKLVMPPNTLGGGVFMVEATADHGCRYAIACTRLWPKAKRNRSSG